MSDDSKRARARANSKRYYWRHADKQREKARQWYQDNLEKAREAVKTRRAANREKYLAARRRKYQERREAILAARRVARLRDPVKARADDKRKREVNRKNVRDATRRWKQRNPEKVRAGNAKNRAWRAGVPGDASEEQIKARVEYYGNVCAYCRNGPYEHLDHVIPVSRGGTNWPANRRPACASCNLRKNRRPLAVFLQELREGDRQLC